jgi:GNAT superfamily N-acetyltransferase
MQTKNIRYSEKALGFYPVDPKLDYFRLKDFVSDLSASTVRARFGYSIKPEYLLDVFLHLTNPTLLIVGSNNIGMFDHSELLIDKLGLTYCEIALVVKDEYQGQGYGSMIIEHLIKKLSGLGVNYILANIDMENRNSLTLFRRNHFNLNFDYQHQVVDATFTL